ncbi:MAG: MATE family efflux transporter [Ruminiclostridium sp.]|nr:MATE family efflux transporter [Ruminiclostridium sp.]
MSEEKELSAKDRRFREFVLGADMWKVIFTISLPLAAYQGLLQIFKMLDTMMAAHIGTDAVSSVAYISQIGFVISAIGGGLAIGAGMKISEAYGAGNYDLVKKRVSSVCFLCFLISIPVLLVIPFTPQFLRLNGTPEELIEASGQYFSVELVNIAVNFFNVVYIAIERARGNTKLIMWINVVYLVVKTVLTAVFVYVLNGTVVMIAIATLAANLAMFVIAAVNMLKKDSIFAFSRKQISLRKAVILPVINTSYPAVTEKAAFAYGKLIVNKMSTDYGTSVVGALGVSNNLGGITTNLQNGFQEGGASVISQNIGAGNIGRALDAFKKTLIINVALGAVFMSLTLIFLDPLSSLFAGQDEDFRLLIKDVYGYEALGAVTLGINAAVMALLYGFGYTKLTLVLNILRVFVFRIPVLWFLQNYTDIGSASVGIVMMVSNISVGICAAIAGAFVIVHIRKRSALSNG